MVLRVVVNKLVLVAHRQVLIRECSLNMPRGGPVQNRGGHEFFFG